jgi:hypothetical protein
MIKSLKTFREELQESLLTLLWQQWCICGVQGHAAEPGTWCIDPEVLILLTCSIGRREPRLFDEMLDLLKSTQGMISLQRLKMIAKSDAFAEKNVLAAVAGFIDKTLKTKIWTNAIKKNNESIKTQEPLFFFKDGRPMESFGKTDPLFKENGFLRGPIALRGLVGPFDLRHPACLLLRFRSFFGATSRSGICLYLCTHFDNSGETPTRIAKETGHAQRSVQNALVSMSKSGYITRHEHARDTLYTIAPEMRESLLMDLKAKPLWCNWIVIGSFLENIRQVFDSKKFLEADPQIQSIMLREIVDNFKIPISKSGMPVTIDLQGHLEGEEYVGWVVEKVKKMLDALIGH